MTVNSCERSEAVLRSQPPFKPRSHRTNWSKEFKVTRLTPINKYCNLIAPLMPPNTFSLTVLLVPGTTYQTWWSTLPHYPPLNVTFPFLTSRVIHSNISQYYIFLLTASIFCSFVSVVFLSGLLVYLRFFLC